VFRGKKRHLIHVNHSPALQEDIEPRFWRRCRWTQRGLDLLPAGTDAFEARGGQRGAVAPDQFNEDARRTFDAADLDGEIVRFAGAHAHAAEALVADAERRDGLGAEAEVMRAGRFHGSSVRTVNSPFARLGLILNQPIRASGNSKEPFFTSSAYSPPSAPKLMSSKKIPHMAGLIFAPADWLER